ncbi:SIMPL domain-containing protein [Christiangramia forsetii]|uniref:Uncharacterized protein n=2 Tax=Christiangramia forsetii TaxID=411153 RepID=A0M3J9_CHRFK|nr:SIMPL domain-containing protein [Christiangramia forsetii]GGG25690.1 hypothetical protein GCM10011532_06270 [Christiangramia forsetii]CAL67194.1 conserved hypothetical protein [Christiangramia forsetii KT0803]
MKYISAIVFSLAIVIAEYFLGNSYVSRANPDGVISVTGSGSENFTSDHNVWERQFSRTSANLEQNKETVYDYLISKGIKAENLVFNSVNTGEQQENQYQNGNYAGSVFKGYLLSQSVKIESTMWTVFIM